MILARIFKKIYKTIEMFNDIGLNYYLKLRKNNIHYSRYKLFDKKWIKSLNINTVIDIGANVGEFTLIFHYLFNRPKIYAFEPLPSGKNKRMNIENEKGNITYFPFALGNENTKKKFNISSWAPSSSFLPMGNSHKTAYPHSADSKEIEVECKKLDSLLSLNDIEDSLMIKIDVQGFEKYVIEGGNKLFKKASIIIIEMSYIELYEDEPLFDEIYKLITNLGFNYAGSLKQSESKKNNVCLQNDGIFINKKIKLNEF